MVATFSRTEFADDGIQPTGTRLEPEVGHLEGAPAAPAMQRYSTSLARSEPPSRSARSNHGERVARSRGRPFALPATSPWRSMAASAWAVKECTTRPSSRTRSVGSLPSGWSLLSRGGQHQRRTELHMLVLGDHHDARLGDVEALGVVVMVVADDVVGEDHHVLVDDAASHARAAADVDVVEQDRAVHLGVAVDAAGAPDHRVDHRGS